MSLIPDTLIVKLSSDTRSYVATWLPMATALAAVFVGPIVQLFIGRSQLRRQSESLTKQLEAQQLTTSQQLATQRAVADQQFGATVISATRTKRIETLRQQVAEYLAIARWIERQRVSTDPEVTKKVPDRRERLMSLGYEIELALSPTGDLAKRVIENVKVLGRTVDERGDGNKTTLREARGRIIDHMRVLIEQEWTQARAGM